MAPLLLILIAAAVAFVWLRGARRNRAIWLERLHLPGLWRGDGGIRLELGGRLDTGAYRLVVAGREERGTWSVSGSELLLHGEGESSPRRYVMRYFDRGVIGLHGQALNRAVLHRAADNVVPLRRLQ